MADLPTREQLLLAIQGTLSDLSDQLEREGLPTIDQADKPDEDGVYFSGQLPRIQETWTDDEGVEQTESVYDGGWGFLVDVKMVQRD